MVNKLDIVVFGATGYTGKFVLVQVHKLANNLTWGISGRNEEKLKDLLGETAKRVGVDNLDNVQVIVADVEHEESIRQMTSQAKVIINCCGPYYTYGEIVVKSCIETGTHYVDVTGEKDFIVEMLQKYGKIAEEKGVYIVNACGYSCIPTDMGICYMEDNFTGTLNSAELYRHNYEEGGSTPGPALNYGTWASLVLVCANFFKFNKEAPQTKLPVLKPKLSKKFVHKVDNSWVIPFFSPEDDIVKRSQQFFYNHYNKRPIQMQNYMIVPSFFYIIFNGIFVLLSFILAQCKCGRDLLLKYPEFFSNGICAHLPAEEKVARMRFTLTLKCQGWSDKLPEGQDQYQTLPNKEILGCISGANPGYGFTATAVTLCALIILTEPNNLPSKGGVYTPAMAFSKTSLIQQLQNNGVVFKVLSVKDI